MISPVFGGGNSLPKAGRQLMISLADRTPSFTISCRVDSFTSEVSHWSKGISLFSHGRGLERKDLELGVEVFGRKCREEVARGKS